MDRSYDPVGILGTASDGVKRVAARAGFKVSVQLSSEGVIGSHSPPGSVILSGAGVERSGTRAESKDPYLSIIPQVEIPRSAWNDKSRLDRGHPELPAILFRQGLDVETLKQ